MKMSFSSPEEWSGAPGWVETLNLLIFKFHEANLTPGVMDDLICFKALLNHGSCRIRAKFGKGKRELLTYYVSDVNGGDVDLIEWFDLKISDIEVVNTRVFKAQNTGEETGQRDLKLQSESKKMVEQLFRELMLTLQLLNVFDFVYKYKDEQDLTRDL